MKRTGKDAPITVSPSSNVDPRNRMRLANPSCPPAHRADDAPVPRLDPASADYCAPAPARTDPPAAPLARQASAARWDIEKGQCDIEKGQCDIEKGQCDIEKGKCDIEKGKCDIEKGKCDIEKGKCDIEKGKCDIEKGRSNRHERADRPRETGARPREQGGRPDECFGETHQAAVVDHAREALDARRECLEGRDVVQILDRARGVELRATWARAATSGSSPSSRVPSTDGAEKGGPIRAQGRCHRAHPPPARAPAEATPTRTTSEAGTAARQRPRTPGDRHPPRHRSALLHRVAAQAPPSTLCMSAAGEDLLGAATELSRITVGHRRVASRRARGARPASVRLLDDLAERHFIGPMRRVAPKPLCRKAPLGG
jgi:hypothetical protein